MPNLEAFQNFTLRRRSFLAMASSVVGLTNLQKPPLLCDVSLPQFWFGDRVIDQYFGEDPKDITRQIEVTYRGTVVGLAWGKQHCYGNLTPERWWYAVLWDDEPNEPLSSLYYTEKELKPEALASPNVLSGNLRRTRCKFCGLHNV